MINKLKTISTNIIKKFKTDEKVAIQGVTWGLPLAMIPSLRFAQDVDKPKKDRNELFLRDFTSYAVGVGLYAVSAFPLTKKLDKVKDLSPFKKSVLPIAAGTTAFSIWSGVFAPKLSKYLTKCDDNSGKIKEMYSPQAETPKKLDIKEGEVAFSRNKNNIFNKASKNLKPNKNLYSNPLLSQLNNSRYHNLKI